MSQYYSCECLKKETGFSERANYLYQGQPTWNNLRWLSRGSVFHRLVGCSDQWIDFVLLISLVFKWFGHQIASIRRTLDIVVDNIKALKWNLKFFKCDVGRGNFKYFPNPQNTRLIFSKFNCKCILNDLVIATCT